MLSNGVFRKPESELSRCDIPASDRYMAGSFLEGWTFLLHFIVKIQTDLHYNQYSILYAGPEFN